MGRRLMGEYLRELQRKRAAQTHERTRPPGRFARAGGSALVLVLLALGLVLLVAGVVRLSPVAIGGALVVVGSGLLWWWSNRVREHGSGSRFHYGEMAEVRLSFLSITGFLVGLFGWLIGMIEGW